MVAHAIAGSALWQVRLEPQRAANEAIASSIEASPAEAAFAAKLREVLALFGRSDDDMTVAGGHGDDLTLATIFVQLLALTDEGVVRVLAVVMAETLAAGSAIIELLGAYLKVDMAACWQADDAFFDLLRDREVANAMLAEIGDKQVADGNFAEKVKTQKTIIRDFISGENGRQKAEGWLPRWLKFPVESYTERGGFRTVDQWSMVKALIVSE